MLQGNYLVYFTMLSPPCHYFPNSIKIFVEPPMHPHPMMINNFGKSLSKTNAKGGGFRLGIFLLHSSKNSHLIVALLLHSYYILDTSFLTWWCMVLWNHGFILACSYLCEPFKLVKSFSPFSLGSQILSMFLRWQHKAIRCFHGPIIYKEHSLPYQPCPLSSNDYPFWLLSNWMLQKQNQLQLT